MLALSLLSFFATALALPTPNCFNCGPLSIFIPPRYWDLPPSLRPKNPTDIWAGPAEEAPAYVAAIAARDVSPVEDDMAGVYICEDVAWGGECTHHVTPLGSDPEACTIIDPRASSIGPDEGFYCLFYTNAFCAPLASDGSDTLSLSYPGTDNLLVTQKGDYNDRLHSYQCFREEAVSTGPEVGTPPNLVEDGDEEDVEESGNVPSLHERGSDEAVLAAAGPCQHACQRQDTPVKTSLMDDSTPFRVIVGYHGAFLRARRRHCGVTITEDLMRLNGDLRDLMQQPTGATLSSGDEAMMKLGEKCDEVALRLVDALNRLQKKPQKSKKYEVWDSFHKALRTVWDEASIKALTDDLQSYRQQLTMQLLVDQRELVISAAKEQRQNGQVQTRAIENNTELSRAILAKLNKRSVDINFLATTIEQSYSQGAGIMTATPTAKVHSVLQKHDTSEASKLVLHQLHFHELTYRYQRVAVAHRETFEWLYHAPVEPNSWTNFVDWLQSDTKPLYWVTGKPGAGKSTLMRFIVDHPTTSRILHRWQGIKQLLKISFFFWNSGTEMQMSYRGLVRSLLYQILVQLPEMIPTTFPHRVLDSILFKRFLSKQQDWTWTWDELMIALRTLIRDCTQDYKIMMFIDGLDEFNGKSSAIIEFIRELLVPGVKICASSQKLTSQDIEHFVSSQLRLTPAFKDYEESQPGVLQQIVQNVCQKSEGVFLWVRLATNSLLEGLQDGQSLSTLQVRLDDLPSDLEDLFDKILVGLDPQHSEQSSQLFQIHRNSLQPLTLLDMCFAAEENPDYAIEVPYEKMLKEQANANCRLMHRKINACTKGLLEAGPRTAGDIANAEVRLLHRTVKDYLERTLVWDKICRMTSGAFDSDFRLFNCHLMRIKANTQWDSLQKTDFHDGDVLLATEYALRSKSVDYTQRKKLLRSLELSYAHYVFTLSQYPVRNLQDPLTNVKTFLYVPMYCGFFEYIDEGMKSLKYQNRKKIADRLLWFALTWSDFSPLPNRPHLRHSLPSAQFVRLLLENGAEPNSMQFGKNTLWEELFDLIFSETRYCSADVPIFIEDFIRFGADIASLDLRQYLRTTKHDTTGIKALLKLKKRELTWKQRIFYYVSRFNPKCLADTRREQEQKIQSEVE
ncbi:hypothetical protein OPT61_g8575 [Boeremia exigua]|uniref:Uncharacterized protein n=1 Tax=Boeremia exigua TaxID=749465 RepID=A0ACC2HY22_9PLEO|nr:hypothetical protein OPT61_g8575 [Boeremia exigua]